MSERAFEFVRVNEREGKPRTRGLTEIRGPYYTPIGRRCLDASIPLVMIESEGITENVKEWRADVIAAAARLTNSTASRPSAASTTR
jgi:phosphosulfolactate synthase (CoM biosynthesis protein A)